MHTWVAKATPGTKSFDALLFFNTNTSAKLSVQPKSATPSLFFTCNVWTTVSWISGLWTDRKSLWRADARSLLCYFGELTQRTLKCLFKGQKKKNQLSANTKFVRYVLTDCKLSSSNALNLTQIWKKAEQTCPMKVYRRSLNPDVYGVSWDSLSFHT